MLWHSYRIPVSLKLAIYRHTGRKHIYYTFPSRKGKGIEFAADVRPVFPEERLLVEILMGKPFAFSNSSVWASSGDRYYVDGKRISFSTIKHSNADAEAVRKQWDDLASQNSYDVFDQYTNRFILANRTRVHFIETEAMQYIQQAAEKFDLGSMFVSFSGGKDSTVVSDLVTRALGRADVLHIFGNTTLEFPQTIQYVEDFRKLHPMTPMLRAENRQQDFYTLCDLFGPPSRMLRWCCTIFKTGYIGDKIKQTFADEKQVLVFKVAVRDIALPFYDAAYQVRRRSPFGGSLGGHRCLCQKRSWQEG